jgi:hypothetical protein
VNCIACAQTAEKSNEIVQKLRDFEAELIETARRILNTSRDPFSAVIRFLHERPENSSLPGYLVHKVLLETFGDMESVPSLVRVLAAHVRSIVRNANVIELILEHPATERWGNFMIKQKERVKFEVAFDKGRLVLNNISGLIGIENGLECPLERIQVMPPKLIVTVKLGLLHPQKEVDI